MLSLSASQPLSLSALLILVLGMSAQGASGECCVDTRGVAGRYEVDPSLYSGAARNDWHYVEVVYNCDLDLYGWSNRAGISWTLKFKDDGEFAVGEDSPYYDDGHRSGHMECSDSGQIITGPSNEPYILMESKPYSASCGTESAALVGTWCSNSPGATPAPPSGDYCNSERGIAGDYEIDPSLYSFDQRNEWHYVDISYDCSTDRYTWTNRAGVSWSLDNFNPSIYSLDVGKECPYYNDGHTKAMIKCEGSAKEQRVLGPWGEAYILQSPKFSPAGCLREPSFSYSDGSVASSMSFSTEASGPPIAVIVGASAGVLAGLTTFVCLYWRLCRNRPQAAQTLSTRFAEPYSPSAPQPPVGMPVTGLPVRPSAPPPFNPSAPQLHSETSIASIGVAPPPYSLEEQWGPPPAYKREASYISPPTYN